MAKAGHWETEKAAQELKIHESEELRKKNRLLRDARSITAVLLCCAESRQT